MRALQVAPRTNKDGVAVRVDGNLERSRSCQNRTPRFPHTATYGLRTARLNAAIPNIVLAIPRLTSRRVLANVTTQSCSTIANSLRHTVLPLCRAPTARTVKRFDDVSMCSSVEIIRFVAVIPGILSLLCLLFIDSHVP